MKTLHIFLSLLFAASVLSGQYSNGAFLSASDFSPEETRTKRKCPDQLSGKWVAGGVLTYNFQQVGNIYLAIVDAYNPEYPWFQRGEVAAVITYSSFGQYQFAVRMKNQDGSEKVVKKTLNYKDDLFTEVSTGATIRRLAHSTQDPPFASVQPSAVIPHAKNRAKQSVNAKLHSREAVNRVADNSTNAYTIPQRSNHTINSQANLSYHNNPYTDRHASYAGYQNRDQEVRYFRAEQSSGKKKKKKGGFGKFLKGAGKFVSGAIGAYADVNGMVSAVGGNAALSSGDALAGIVSSLSKSSKSKDYNDTFNDLTNLLSGNGDQGELINALSSLIGSQSGTNQSEDLVRKLGELLAQKSGDNLFNKNSHNAQEWIDNYSKQYLDSFEKNYGHLLEKLGYK